MNRQRKWMIVALGAIVLGIVFTFLRESREADTKSQTIRMGSFSTAIDYAPYLIAKEKKWFEAAFRADGIGFEYTTFQTLPPINEALATGNVDIVFEAEVPVIIGRAAGIDVRFGSMICTLTSEMAVPSDSTVASLSELQGKKIAVLAGSGVHYGLAQNLEQTGLSRESVEIVDMIPPDAKVAFETGTVDAWAIWPPWIEQELVAGLGRVLPDVKVPVQVVMAVRGQFADEQPESVAKIIGVLDRAKAWLAENPAEAQQVVSDTLDLPQEVVRLAWPKNDWTATFSPHVQTDLQAKADFLKKEGFTKKAITVEDALMTVSARGQSAG